jgi:hypothetical protein
LVAAFVGLAAMGLFVPTIELFKGALSLGRAPVWLAYVGIFTPEYREIAIPIAFAHLSVAFLLAFLVERVLRKGALNPLRDATPACLRASVKSGSNSEMQCTVLILPLSSARISLEVFQWSWGRKFPWSFDDQKDSFMNVENFASLGLLLIGLVTTGVVCWFTLRRIAEPVARSSASRWLAMFGLSICTFMSIMPLLSQNQLWISLLPFVGIWLSLDSLHRLGERAADRAAKMVSDES